MTKPALRSLAAAILLISAFLVVQADVLASGGPARLVGPVQQWDSAALDGFRTSRVHLKFVEGSDVSLRDGAFVKEDGSAVLSPVLARFGARPVAPTFNVDRATARAWKAAGEARSGRPGPDLSLWFEVEVPGGAAALGQALNALNACPEIEIAHPEPIPSLAVLSDPAPAAVEAPFRTTPDFTGRQEYLGATPIGLNAPAAWAVAGGRGEGMQYIDVELAWTVNHEDFLSGNCFYVGGATQNPGYETHGTAVLGEILGQNNGFGVNGFAPAVQFGVVAVTVGEWPVVPQYFQEAVDHLRPGDVWLIELQMPGPGGQNPVPMEYLQVNYDVIWTSVWGRGVVCIEAGANGSFDLDGPQFYGLFDRNQRDSGAIMVAAGTPYGRVAEYFTNYGSRMDAHSWGSSITTTGYGDLYNGGTLQTRYTAGFSGTSGASPMITGTAICLQGIARAQFGEPLAPDVLRSIITNTGVPSLDHVHLIGPRPDLAAAVAAVQGSAGVREPATTLRLAVAPNPLRTSTEIRFDPPANGRATLSIYDAAGRMLRSFQEPGSGRILWDGRDAAGRALGNGTYFLRLQAGPESGNRKLEILR